MNPILDMARGSGAIPGGDLLQRFMAFRQSFTGDARQQIQQLLNSGRVTQEQYNRAVQIAQQLRGMIR